MTSSTVLFALTYCFQILNENKAPEVRSNYKSQNREKLFMPCRQEVKEKAILDGIQVSTLAGNVQNVFFINLYIIW